MHILVTGAAGFIGSNLVKALNARGENQIIAVDDLTHGDKFTNLVDCAIADYWDKDTLFDRLAERREREAVLPEELPLIASVYRNRLAIDMPLQADPTVQYAVSSRPGSVVEFGYWKRQLTLQDLAFDSTYNTYVKRGLPPGPIDNPGIEAIEAVIRPAPTTYLFFVARNDGTHEFSKTEEEHEQWVEIYQRQGKVGPQRK